jgi:hypothetical protein
MSKISFYQDRKGVEVRVFELSSEIEDRDEVEVATGRSTKRPFCAIVLYLVVYHVCFQDGKLCLLVANDKLDGK